MFLHVGNNKNIRQRDIIGIFDIDNTTASSAITKKYLATAERRGETESAGEDLPKSFILYRVQTDGGRMGQRRRYKTKICFSLLSSSSLVGRTE
jgi:hypothetical protein